MSTRVGELGVGLELVGLEGLLEPVDAELLELARHADRAVGIGAVAEAGVDQDLHLVAGRALGGTRESHVVLLVLADRTPAELDRREAHRGELARRCAATSRSVSGIRSDA